MIDTTMREVIRSFNLQGSHSFIHNVQGFRAHPLPANHDRVTMPTPTWDLALVELIYSISISVPMLYCTWKHRHTATPGWLFLLLFLVLQVVGSGMTLSADSNGTPSSASVIIGDVDLSALMLGMAGVVRTWVERVGLLSTRPRKQRALVVLVLYHLLVAGAVAVYAIGSSNSFHTSPGSDSKALMKAGVTLLLLLSASLCAMFVLLASRVGIDAVNPLFWSIAMSFVLLKARLIYECVATFDSSNPSFNPVTGSIALRAVFGFLPGALITLTLTIGGIMSNYGASGIPLTWYSEESYGSVTNNTGVDST